MINSLNFKNAFISIFQEESWKKRLLLGCLLQLIMFLPLFAFENDTLLLFAVLESVILLVFLYGYFISTIKENIDSETFAFPAWNIIKFLKNGIKLIFSQVVFLIVFYLFIILFSLILFIPFVFIGNAFGWDELSGWIVIAIVGIIFYYIIIPYLLITLPTSIANYVVEDKFYAFLAFKKMFKIFKKNWKNTLKMLLAIFIFPLMFIPFFGFYFLMVWADLFAQYTRIVNENKLEIE